jgi:enamine deaminase RidA (YjgF/YER057c/UK114 family)
MENILDSFDQVTTMVQVSKLLAPEYLVEIEASAVVGD